MKTYRTIYFLPAFFLLLLQVSYAFAHPHIFVNAQLTVAVTPQQQVAALEQNWVFDSAFTTSIIPDFDKDGDLQLNAAELAGLSASIKESLAEFDFFQSVIRDGQTVSLNPPDFIKAEIRDKQLALSFRVTPKETLVLEKGHSYYFSLYDPSFYVAVDFPQNEDFSVSGLPDTCAAHFIRPDFDKLLSQDLAHRTEDSSKTPSQIDSFAWSAAPRLEVSCK